MNSKYHKLAVLALLFLLAAGGIQTLKAQMFSVRSPERRYSPPGISLYAYLQPTHFYYKPSGSGLTPALRYDFNNPVYGVAFEYGFFSLHLGAGWNLGNGGYVNYLSFGGTIHTVLPLFFNRHVNFGIPIALGIDNLRVQNKRQTTENTTFNQNSGTIGTGLSLGLADMDKNIRFRTNFLVNYGFSARAFGANSGTVFSLRSDTRIYFDRAFGKVGISVGYGYRRDRYNLPGVAYDYVLNGNRILLGVSF